MRNMWGAELRLAILPYRVVFLPIMKTTVEIPDSLLDQAKHMAAKEHSTVRALIEEGLRRVLAERRSAKPFKLRKASFKGRGLHPDMANASWEQIRDAIYEGHGT